MKRLVLIIISLIAMANTFAADEFKVKVDGCSIEFYKEVIGLLEQEDHRQQLGMMSDKCHRGALTERRRGQTTIDINYGNDFMNDCSLELTTQYFCHRLPW